MVCMIVLATRHKMIDQLLEHESEMVKDNMSVQTLL